MRHSILSLLALFIIILCGGCSNTTLDKTLVVPNTTNALVEKDSQFHLQIKLELLLGDDVKYDEDKEHIVEVEYIINNQSYKIKADIDLIENYAGYRILTIIYMTDNINIEKSSGVNVYLDGDKIVNNTKLVRANISDNFVAPDYEEKSSITGQSYETIRLDVDTNELSYDNITSNNINYFNLLQDKDKQGKIVDYYYNEELFQIDDNLNYYLKEGLTDYLFSYYIVIEQDGKKYIQFIQNNINSRPWERFMDDYVDYLKKVNESK